VNLPTWRASARAIAIGLGLGVATAVLAGGVRAEAPSLDPEHVAQTGLEIGLGHAVAAERIVASDFASFEYAEPAVGFVTAVARAPVHRAAASSPAPPSVSGNAVLEEAAKYVGVPYVYGGSTPAGFDCTGFVKYVYGQLGIVLPRSSSSYWSIGTRIAPADAVPGDLIVSSGHVAIYAGGNLEIDAPRRGETIQFREIWQTSYIFVRVS
jgi:cell wall-associated NlpC family hydrolase